MPAVQLQKEAREKEDTLQRMLSAEKRVRSLEEDNRQLRKEHSEMRKELDKLRKEVCCPLSLLLLGGLHVADSSCYLFSGLSQLTTYYSLALIRHVWR